MFSFLGEQKSAVLSCFSFLIMIFLWEFLFNATPNTMQAIIKYWYRKRRSNKPSPHTHARTHTHTRAHMDTHTYTRTTTSNLYPHGIRTPHSLRTYIERFSTFYFLLFLLKIVYKKFPHILFLVTVLSNIHLCTISFSTTNRALLIAFWIAFNAFKR